MTKNKGILILVFIVIVGLGMIGYGLSLPDEKPLTKEGVDGSADNESAQVVLPDIDRKYVRYDEGQGGVQVTAILLSPEYVKATGREDTIGSINLNKNLVFEIAMTTHMGDLRKYPILEKASLSVNGEVLKPAEWKLRADDSHHPVGLLNFTPPESEITIKPGTLIELNLKELEGVSDRKFSWKLL